MPPEHARVWNTTPVAVTTVAVASAATVAADALPWTSAVFHSHYHYRDLQSPTYPRAPSPDQNTSSQRALLARGYRGRCQYGPCGHSECHGHDVGSLFNLVASSAAAGRDLREKVHLVVPRLLGKRNLERHISGLRDDGLAPHGAL